MKIDRSDTALVVIDPRNDVLSEGGVSWGLVGESIRGPARVLPGVGNARLGELEVR